MADSKREIKDKVEKILKLIESKNKEKQDGITSGVEGDSQLVCLIEDFHKLYQSLYARYNHLRGDSRKRSRGRKEKQASSPSNSGSDSEYDSSDDVEINNGKESNEQQKVGNNFKRERRTANIDIADRKQKLESATEEKEASNSENLEATQTAEVVHKNLRYEVHGSQAADKDLEGQLSGFKLELEALRGQKRDLEAQCAMKSTETKQLEKKNKELHGQISKLESVSKNKGNEISNLLKKMKDNDDNLTSKIDDLMAQVNYQQSEVDSLRASENKAVDQVKSLRDQVNVMQRDPVSLTAQKFELELLLEGKTKEISEYMIQVETLKEDLTKKSAIEQRMLKEKEGFLVRVKDLELELESLSNQKNKLEEQLDSRIHDTKLLKEEKERLYARISEREDELSALQRKYEGPGNETSTLILALNAKVRNLQQELYNLQAQKSQLDLAVREKQESSQKLAQLEHQNIKLTTKIADQQRILKEQEDTINKLTEESRQVKHRISGSKVNLQVAERKMSELAEEFRKKLEDHIRVLYRRILVAEQLHNENKDSYRNAKEMLEEEHRYLEKKIATHEVELRKLKDVFQPGSKSLSGLDLAVGNLEGHGDLMSRISDISNELVFAKNWVTEAINEKKRLQQEVDCLVEQLEDKEEQESLLREKICKLETKLGKLNGEKLNILKSMSQLEKLVEELENQIEEKDERWLSLGEEKREAIRQLCLLIDYYRSHCDYLKDEISKMALQSKN